MRKVTQHSTLNSMELNGKERINNVYWFVRLNRDIATGKLNECGWVFNSVFYVPRQTFATGNLYGFVYFDCSRSLVWFVCSLCRSFNVTIGHIVLTQYSGTLHSTTRHTKRDEWCLCIAGLHRVCELWWSPLWKQLKSIRCVSHQFN